MINHKNPLFVWGWDRISAPPPPPPPRDINRQTLRCQTVNLTDRTIFFLSDPDTHERFIYICFGCSKETSHWDGSFEHPQRMFGWEIRKIFFQYALLSRGLRFIVSKQKRPRWEATFGRLSHGSALFTNFTFVVQQPDSLISIAWNWREPNLHL